MPTTLLGTLPIGAWLYMTGTLPLSDFITCIILPIGFIAPLMRVGKYSEQFNMVKACLDQIRDFIEKPELKRPEKMLHWMKQPIALKMFLSLITRRKF